MKSILNRPRRIRKSGIWTCLALSMILAMTIAGPAQAANVHGRGGAGGRDWRQHQGHAHRDWNGRGYGGPGVIYAPPVVYYPPPAYESPGFNLIVPLNIR